MGRHDVERRGVLTGLGAVLGVGALSAWARPAAAEPAPESFELRLTGVRATAAGPQRSAGQQVVLTGRVHDRSGAEVGSFGGVSTAVDATGTDEGLGSIETQTFVLPGGTLVGQGSITHAGVGAFAVVGGTGRWSGAHGSYTVRRELHELGGGTGTCSFRVQRAGGDSDGV